MTYEAIEYHAGFGEHRVLRGKPRYQRLENGLGELHTETLWAAHPVADLPADPLLRVPVTCEVRTAHHEGVQDRS